MGFHQPEEMIRAKATRLKCQDPRIVCWYNQFLEEATAEQQIEQWLLSLQQEKTQLRPSMEQHQEYNQLDKMWAIIKHQAEAQCQKIHGGKIPCVKILGWLRQSA